jgi:hypothetical protein
MPDRSGGEAEETGDGGPLRRQVVGGRGVHWPDPTGWSGVNVSA